ncbi:MAG: CDP-diacylglycerol--glycerol-3-phosphate 3-phosphatidyltransferase [Atopobium sp.]|uniref:CDP-diacylglycerol--glycerol-3-phosphate 3-phosphatidyltransferase n=1 Tax=Atopobium sp. TaxID=1872650 RepID=UPI002A751621|nr:CDP-diacylglycerol--glycerol-3-phosphate 3-phosphatidyltransferase [Atopobium sp.]MDY2788204.1 CDP-diacylglycerol--glycerol-3-phosphate 3-phosphatidyltransferase [Atopobium sp.]MDY4522566.1 CDP-diacylglycerol--glycerol-3-phosphate 3-phosphatidyltransferase [Atopobium sp.]
MSTNSSSNKTGSGIRWTAANIVTTIRVVLIPAWILMAELIPAKSNGTAINWGGFAVFAFFTFLSLTDKIDGYLARSRGEVTVFGKFLDPIADKLLVVTGMVWLLEQSIVPAWSIVLVISREFLVSGLRMVVASKGTVIAASNLGKWKTATTMIALCGYMLALTLPAGIPWLIFFGTSTVSFYSAMILTAWSGIDYFIKSWSSLGEE